MKLTRVTLAAAILAGAACAALAPAPPRSPAPLVARAPKLPVSESLPPAASPEGPVKAAVFARINSDREKNGLPPVAWDEAAARVADAYTAAQVAEGTTGHFLTNGLPPYARTAFAGIFGSGSENAVAWHTTAPVFTDSAEELALAGQEDMMREKPPKDGHRRTILDPDVTHVGVGWAMHGGSFRMAEEFLVRRLQELTIRQEGDSLSVSGRPEAPYQLSFVTIAHEPPPKPLTREAARSRTTYQYPEPQQAFVAEGRKSIRIVGTETEDRIRLGANGDFSFRFAPRQPGLWTFVFYASDGRQRPRPGGAAVVWMETSASR